MGQSLPADTTVYLVLFLSVIALYQFKGKIPSGTRTLPAEVARKSINMAVTGLILSVLLYRHIRSVTIYPAGFDTWTIAIDIVVVHIVLTWTLISEAFSIIVFFAFSLYMLGALVIYKVSLKQKDEFGFEEILYWKTLHEGKWWQKSLLIFISLLICVIVAVSLYGIYWSVRFLLVDTNNLQLFLFGKFDKDLGWQYPTTYRFSILFQHVKGLIQNLVGNEVIAILIGFFGIVISVMLGASTLIDAISKIGEKFQAPKRER